VEDPQALQALAWLRTYAAPERIPPDGYILVTRQSKPWPGWNTTWQFALTVEGLLAGQEVESFGASRPVSV
jgi:hypothetical protein